MIPLRMERETIATGDLVAAACSIDDPKLGAMAEILRARFGRPRKVLVVGCGDGSEAAVLAELLEASVTGIDVVEGFHPDARSRVELIVADATSLPFESGTFDLVFSYHALEHIASPGRAVAEMRRVLDEDGGCWIGTPNRSRVIGYLGSRDATRREKLTWNLADWRGRLQGRFRNELGAHAGFHESELGAMIRASFVQVHNETSAYYALVYASHQRLLGALERSRLSRFLYPAVYFSASCRPSG